VDAVTKNLNELQKKRRRQTKDCGIAMHLDENAASNE